MDSNNLQVVRYYEERAKGRKIPIVGVTDCHHCESNRLFGWYYTIVFSPGLELEEITGSIKDLYSVAVESLPGVPAKAYGDFRLVKYALFLIREVFPCHDELCHVEGQMMLNYIRGDESAANVLSHLKGRTADLMEKVFSVDNMR